MGKRIRELILIWIRGMLIISSLQLLIPYSFYELTNFLTNSAHGWWQIISNMEVGYTNDRPK